MNPLMQIVLVNASSALILALLVAATELLIRRPGVIHVFWLVVLLRLLVPPIFSLPVEINTANSLAEGVLTLPPVDVGPGVPQTVPAGAFSYRLGLLHLWGMGLFFFLVLTGLRLRNLWTALAQAVPAPSSVAHRMEALATRMKISQPPRALLVDAEVSPMLWSALGSTRLILPASLLERLRDDELDALLAHELAHFKRKDHWVRHCELLCKLLFWWHPVVWWASRRLHRAEEQCCDFLVRRTLPKHRRAYADCILKTMDYLADSKRSVELASGMGAVHHLKERLEMILSHPAPRTLPASLRVLVGVSCFVVLTVFPTLAQESENEVSQGDSLEVAAEAVELSKITRKPISVHLEETDLREVLTAFGHWADLEIVLDEGISGTVTAKLEEVPWDQALSAILRINGLKPSLEGDVLRVHRRWESSDG